MTSEERAQQYADLFTHYDKTGVDWRKNVPLDGKVKGDILHLDGLRIYRRSTGRWVVTT